MKKFDQFINESVDLTVEQCETYLRAIFHYYKALMDRLNIIPIEDTPWVLVEKAANGNHKCTLNFYFTNRMITQAEVQAGKYEEHAENHLQMVQAINIISHRHFKTNVRYSADYRADDKIGVVFAVDAGYLKENEDFIKSLSTVKKFDL